MERDENQENILEDIIRGPEDVVDVTSQFWTTPVREMSLSTEETAPVR